MWLVILMGVGYLPAGHPAAIGIVLSIVLGAPLLPLALWADLRQARDVSNCPPTTREYLQNVSSDMKNSIVNHTTLGTEQVALFDCDLEESEVR